MRNLQIVSNLISHKIEIYLNRSTPIFGNVENKGELIHQYSYNPNIWKGGTDYESTLAMAKRHLATLQTLSDKQIQTIIDNLQKQLQ